MRSRSIDTADQREGGSAFCARSWLLSSLLLFSPACLCGSGHAGRESPSAPPAAAKAGKWLGNQQDIKTGLLYRSDRPGRRAAATYDQAVAIIALLELGDVVAARRCADGMLARLDDTQAAWPDEYCDTKAGVKGVGNTAVGPNAWMGLALLRLYQATRQERYLQAAKRIAEFVLKLQTRRGPAEGAVAGGYDDKGKALNWTSTEHNADALALFAGLARITGKKRHLDAAVRTAKWLDREMWDKKAGCYHPGYADNAKRTLSRFPERLDSQTWTVLALVAAARTPGWPVKAAGLLHNGLPCIDKLQCTVKYKGHDLIGFPKITHGLRAKDSVWFEGTVGYILAARRVRHRSGEMADFARSLRALQQADGAGLHSVGVYFPEITRQFGPGHLLVAHFEGHPNCLHGAVRVHGDGEPDAAAIQSARYTIPCSGYLIPEKPGYDSGNVHTGLQSFCLVNAGATCKTKTRGWSSLGVDLGPPTPSGKVQTLDARGYKALVFWAKTDRKSGARLKVLFRDARARNMMPQAAVQPTPRLLSRKWRRFRVDLSAAAQRVDLTRLVHVGFSFGANVGNPPGTTIYVDDLAFLAKRPRRPNAAAKKLPVVYPQHWPFPDVAATAWLIFMELDDNPFEIKETFLNPRGQRSQSPRGAAEHEGHTSIHSD